MTLFNLSVYWETTGGTIGHCAEERLHTRDCWVMTVPLWQTDSSPPSLRSEAPRERRSSSAGRSGTPAHDTGTRNTHTRVQKWHESRLATRKFNSRLRLSALPDWCYRYYWFYCRSIEVSSRVMRKMRWAGASHSGIGWRYSPRRHPLGRGAGLGGGRCGSGPFSGTPQPHSQAVRWPLAAPDSRKTWEDLNYWWILINLFLFFFSNQKIFWIPVLVILSSLRFREETHPHSLKAQNIREKRKITQSVTNQL